MEIQIFEIEIVAEDLPEKVSGDVEELRNLISETIGDKFGIEEEISYHVEAINI